MPANLVIVESPSKAKTIEKYLGPDFQVLASYGHVQDLVPKDGAVDTENEYQLKYQVEPRSEKHLRAISAALKKCEALYLASDPDREGEAISWSLQTLLERRKKLTDKKIYRVVFHEITPEAVTYALKHPRAVSSDLVNAYQARRAIDHLFGFNLSPLLWRKIAPKLSAGRVQSPALRMIVEREMEIEAFKPQEYWTVHATLAHDGQQFPAKLHALDGKTLKKFDLPDEATSKAAHDAVQACAGYLQVMQVERKERHRHPTPPFTTSTLQQEASRKLRFSARRTMQIAQQLYEGVDLGSGAVGLISYMRTDSVTLSASALRNLREVITERYGKDQLPPSPRRFKTKTRNAQEAHEAIRPTDASLLPEKVRNALTEDQRRLYELIWKRAVACQMIPAVIDQVGVDLSVKNTQILTHATPPLKVPTLRAVGSHVRVPGFMQVYLEGSDVKVASDEQYLPKLSEGDAVTIENVEARQHYTEPPPRYTEASLVKKLEENGIGRPSTYADTMTKLVSRQYAVLNKRAFVPTAVGKAVCKFLSEHFTSYVDYQFTAQMEDTLDSVARGETQWVPVVDKFWKPFAAQLEDKSTTVSRHDAQMMRELGMDPKSGKPVRVRVGRYGPFVQLGDREDEEKPRFASLREDQSFENLTLDEALDLLKLPRSLGVSDAGDPIEVNLGRYGPFVKYGEKKYVSLPEGEDPLTITRERAEELIAAHKQAQANRIIQDFGDIQVLNGRYGPYITRSGQNVKVPKDQDPATLTQAECETYLAQAPARKRRAGGRRTAAKKKRKS